MSVRAPQVRRAAACVVAAAALLVAGPARAERRPVLVVDGTPDGAGAEAVSALEAQLAREDALGPAAFDIVDALRRPTVPAETWEADANAALAEARAALTRFGYREAADRAHGALDRLAVFAERPAARKLLADLALIEGQALIGAGDGERGAIAMRLVHRLDPGRTIDPARYLPEVVTAYVAAGRSAAATGELQLTAPGAAELLVDGVAVGGEPRVVALVPGPHLIAARGEAIVSVGRRVDVPDGQAMRVDLVPRVAPLPVRVTRVMTRLRTATGDATLADAVATLLALAQARDAVIVVRGEAGLATRLFTARRGLGPPRALEEPARVMAPLRPLVVKPVGPPLPPPPPPEPWYRQRWGKTTIGVGVGVVLAGIVTAMFVRDPGSSSYDGGLGVD
jgi:hypothetical protein